MIKAVTARKPHRCQECRRMAIRPGHRYLRYVSFPDRRPWVSKQCFACALADAEMPGTEVDDPIMMMAVCATYCCGTGACALPDPHSGEHSCQRCA